MASYVGAGSKIRDLEQLQEHHPAGWKHINPTTIVSGELTPETAKKLLKSIRDSSYSLQAETREGPPPGSGELRMRQVIVSTGKLPISPRQIPLPYLRQKENTPPLQSASYPPDPGSEIRAASLVPAFQINEVRPPVHVKEMLDLLKTKYPQYSWILEGEQCIAIVPRKDCIVPRKDCIDPKKSLDLKTKINTTSGLKAKLEFTGNPENLKIIVTICDPKKFQDYAL